MHLPPAEAGPAAFGAPHVERIERLVTARHGRSTATMIIRDTRKTGGSTAFRFIRDSHRAPLRCLLGPAVALALVLARLAEVALGLPVAVGARAHWRHRSVGSRVSAGAHDSALRCSRTG